TGMLIRTLAVVLLLSAPATAQRSSDSIGGVLDGLTEHAAAETGNDCDDLPGMLAVGCFAAHPDLLSWETGQGARTLRPLHMDGAWEARFTSTRPGAVWLLDQGGDRTRELVSVTSTRGGMN